MFLKTFSILNKVCKNKSSWKQSDLHKSWKLETTHTVIERMKRKRENKLIEDLVFYYST
jgi:hypothetical protein